VRLNGSGATMRAYDAELPDRVAVINWEPALPRVRLAEQPGPPTGGAAGSCPRARAGSR
jgi:hypothetical protein